MHYVISDIHGNERRFHALLRMIRLQPEDTLYVLGDVVDRHPGGIRILRKIMSMPNARMLLGNHEYMMLRALGFPRDDYRDNGGARAHWFRNGGEVTLNHFKYLRKTLRQEIVEYLQGLPLSFDVEVNGTHFKLVHGAPAEEYVPAPKYPSAAYYAVWKRLDVGEPSPEGYLLIFGHTPTRYYQESCPMKVWRDGNRIGIDCGCGYPEEDPRGRLACLRLEDGKTYYVQ